MRKVWKVVLISIVLLSPGHILAAEETAGKEIAIVKTAGNLSISTNKILSKVRSRAGQMFDPATAAEDAKRIAQLPGVEYSYYSTSVIDNKIGLTFVVVEKNIARSITFVGNHRFKAKKLRKKLDFKIGDYIEPMIAESGRAALIQYYQKKGYAFAKVTLDSESLKKGRLIYAIDEGQRVKIESVKFSGNSRFKTRSLKRTVKTKKRKFFIFSRYLIDDKVTQDVTRLQKLYQKKGFLNAHIAVKRQFNKDKSRVRLTFEVEEGSAYTVEDIVFVGNKHFDRQRLQSELKLQPKQVYNETKAASDAKRLTSLYREKGFVDAEVELRRRFTSPTTVIGEFEITEGRRFKIGLINISGNEKTQDKVIRRVLDEYDFQPGKWYNADIARGNGTGELEKIIRRMALTESTITPSGDSPGQKDAQVNVVEGQTGMVMVGAGVASDSGVIGQLVFEQRNFDIRDRPESFSDFITGKAFKGAGQNLRIALEPGTEVSQYSISFTEPYLNDRPISLDVVGSSWKRFRESYDEERIRGYVGFQKRYKNRWRRSVRFRLENVDVTDLDTDAPQEIIDEKGSNALAGIKLGFGRDLTDNRFNPSKGYSFDLSYEQVGGDHTFGILSGTHRRYKTLYEDLAERKTILATKLLAATVIGDAPSFERFYAGGTGTYGIRGFDYRGVSTRGLQTGVASPTKKDPIGSDWIFLANAEVTIPLATESFAALFFIDSGAIDSGNYRVSVGTGIQILLPQWFGPVPMRFEIAAPIMKDDKDDRQVFSFSVGRLF